MHPPSVARIAADLTSTDAIERNKLWVDVVHEDARGNTYGERVLVDAAKVPSYQNFQDELLAALNAQTGLAATIKPIVDSKAVVA